MSARQVDNISGSASEEQSKGTVTTTATVVGFVVFLITDAIADSQRAVVAFLIAFTSVFALSAFLALVALGVKNAERTSRFQEETRSQLDETRDQLHELMKSVRSLSAGDRAQQEHRAGTAETTVDTGPRADESEEAAAKHDEKDQHGDGRRQEFGRSGTDGD